MGKLNNKNRNPYPHKPERTKKKPAAPKVSYDTDEPPDFRDSAEFKQFAELVAGALTKKPQSIREIRIRAKTENYYWLACALKDLVAAGRAKKIDGWIDKYVLTKAKRKPLPKGNFTGGCRQS